MTTAGLTPLQRAFLALEDTRARLDRLEREPIAIVGIGCRTAGGGDSPAALWRLFRDGIDTIGRVPASRWDADAWFSPDGAAHGRIVTRAGGFLESVDGFDCDVFGIAPREARGMDPQQRLFLEVAWEALEDAGIAPDRLRKSDTGVYLGICSNDYLQLLLASGDPALLDAHFMSGNAHSIASGRLSYLLGLQGPSLSVDTACSSSLVAVHLASQALRAGECRLALAGGVSLMLSPDNFVAYSRAGLLAPDGRCKTFDASADGIGRAEGCAVIALKRVSDAMADGDRILALIRGSAVNQDGPSGSLTAPNGPAQEAVIRAALDRAGVSPHTIGYVEAHGTGTPLGDPMEMRALGAVFGPGRPSDTPLWVGSAKTNLGHLEAAAGIIGLVKLALSLAHRELPPHLHLREPSPHIAWRDLPIRVPEAPVVWPVIEGTRRGGVSSFGFSGTNAHVVLEEAPPAPAQKRLAERTAHVITVSAAREAALVDAAARLETRLAELGDDDLPEVAYTLNTGRAHLPVRAAIVAGSMADLRRDLSSLAAGHTPNRRVSAADRPRVAFLFTGQGSQRAGMGRLLHETSPVFRAAFDECRALLDARLPAPLASIFDESPDAASRLESTAMAQPALFALEYALATLWRSWGVEPVAVLGHSVGDIAAACVAGVLTLSDAAALVAGRGALMDRTAAGGMRAVFASLERVTGAIPHGSGLEIAAINGPEHVVLTGSIEALAAWDAVATEAGLRSRSLRVTRAFHSRLMDPVLDEFEGALSGLACAAPRVRVVSSLTGAVVDAAQLGRASYWREHARRPVRFADGVAALAGLRVDALIEVGPAPVLLQLAEQSLGSAGATWCPSLRPGCDEWTSMLESLRALYLLGVPIDWAAFDKDYDRRRLPLPTYPFTRQRCWFSGSRVCDARRPVAAPSHPLLGRRLRSPLPEVQFECEISPDSPAFIRDHNVGGAVLLPAAAGVELILAAGREMSRDRVVALEAMSLREVMAFEDDGARTVQTIVTPPADGVAAVSVRSTDASADSWTLHYEARIRVGQVPDDRSDVESPSSIASRCDAPESPERLYADQLVQGFFFGPRLRGVRSLRRGRGEALGEIELPEIEHDNRSSYVIHPALLDACVQVMGGALPEEETRGSHADVYVPVSIRRVRVFEPPGLACTSHVAVGAASRPGRSYDLTVRIFSPEGTLSAEIEGLELQRVSAATRLRLGRRGSHLLHEVSWEDARPEREIDVQAPAAGTTAPAFVILADEAGVGVALDAELRRRRCASRLVGIGEEASALAGAGPESRVVDLRWLDAPEWSTAIDASAIVTGLLSRSVDLARALVTSGRGAPRLTIVTRGAQRAGTAGTPVSVVQAAAWGFARSLALEHPEVRARCIDLDPASDPEEMSALADELARTDEPQVAVRGRRRLVPRLVKAAPNEAPHLPEPSYTVEVSQHGLDGLTLSSRSRPEPRVGEVEIAVSATGVNFRDVLNVLGMYPGDAGPIGAECAGVVTRVGPGVSTVAPGDAVVATARACFSGHVVTRHEMVHALPLGCTPVEGASLPIAYLTAGWSLEHLAGLQKGETVLVHAGAGGVGLAAVHLALRTGARVFATAGSDAKRRYLSRLGVELVLDSRSSAFAEHVLAATGGRGADVVLNSLTDERLEATFRATARCGRFVEIGKRGIWTPAQVAALDRSIEYHVVDLGTADREDTARVGALLGRLMAEVGRGVLPVLPVTVFGVAQMRDAFTHMMQARHIGKIVVVHRAAPRPAIRGDAAYLVTGGLSGLGLDVARWLADQGARRLLLVSRRGLTADASSTIDALRASGVEVTASAADVSDQAAMDALVERMRAEGVDLGGIVHAAGVLDDGAIVRLDEARCARVVAPKVGGASVLDRIGRRTSTGFVVSFSSVASLLGSAGQSTYAGANAVLDALAQEQRRLGRMSTSINWGPWRGSGMSARQVAAGGQVHMGVLPMATGDALRALGDALSSGSAQVAAVAADWARVAHGIDGSAAMILSHVAGSAAAASPVRQAPPAGEPLLSDALASAPAGRHRAVLSTFVRDRVARVMGIAEADTIDARTPLGELGLDSLLAVELRNTLSNALDRPLPATLLFDYSTLERLTGYLSDAVLGPSTEVRPGAAVSSPESDGDVLAGIAGLSDEEVEQRLARLQEGSSE